MRRLYQKIYLTIIASLLLVVLVAGARLALGRGGPPGAQVFEMAGELASIALPPADRAAAEQQRAVEQAGAPLPHRSRAVHARTAIRSRRPAGRCRRRRRGGDGGWHSGRAGRPGASACRTTAGSWCARPAGIAIRPSASCCCWAASRSAVALAAYPVVRG